MSEQQLMVEPDLQFIRDMQKAGGDSLKKCYQCATCSVVCNLTPDDSPFPRKEMIWAQWGQKEKLMSDPDVWLCHQCNDCTEKCPRGAKPGDVLAAIRNASFKAYAWPGFFGTMLSRPGLFPIALAIPVVILLFMISIFPTIGGMLPDGIAMFDEFDHAGWGNMPAGQPIVYKNFYPELGVDLTFMSFLGFGLLALFIGLNRFWKTMVRYHGEYGLLGTPVPNVMYALPTIFKHNRFKDCDASKNRYQGHLGVFYGFIGAFITTGIVAFSYWVLGLHTPWPQLSIVKILGNASGLGIVVGGVILLTNRMNYKKSVSSYYDWTLITLVLGLGVTGLGAEFVRLADMRSIAYPTYFLHLVFVAFLFLYLPYSKMAHLAYRTVGMAFARSAQRDLIDEDEVELQPEPAAAK